jgi:hypothetical protein
MSEAGTNAIDPTVAKRWVGDIKAKIDELASERGSYMARCKGIREQIKDMKEAAANAGVPKRGLNHLLKRHVLERKLKEHEDEAEPEVVETADMIDDALGGDKGLAGSPLGAAAGGSEPDDVEDLRGNRQKAKQAAREAEVAEQLKGIKATTAEKAKAKREKRSSALDDVASGRPQ